MNLVVKTAIEYDEQAWVEADAKVAGRTRKLLRGRYSMHQLVGGIPAAEQRTRYGRRIVGPDGLAGKIQPIGDGLLQPQPVVRAGAGSVK